jgi:uncharacterized protein (TIGR00251 family)|tara:strand:- start:922 stop:1293 length:372 start_codon:yes stop_codon:yes gene_type:complete
MLQEDVRLINGLLLIDLMAISSCVQSTLDGAVMLEVDVHPGAKRQGIIGFNEWRGRLTVAVRAEALKGKANNAVLHVLSASLQIPKSQLQIVSGATSRNKKIRIENVSADALVQLLEPHLEEE